MTIEGQRTDFRLSEGSQEMMKQCFRRTDQAVPQQRHREGRGAGLDLRSPGRR